MTPLAHFTVTEWAAAVGAVTGLLGALVRSVRRILAKVDGVLNAVNVNTRENRSLKAQITVLASRVDKIDTLGSDPVQELVEQVRDKLTPAVNDVREKVTNGEAHA